MIRKVVQNTARSCAHVQRVGIIGGMHGNELSGVTLARRWQDEPTFVTRASFETTVEIGNPHAVTKCVRYIDLDLNRCFSYERLGQNISNDAAYEVIRAQELNHIFGPKGSDAAYDVLIDLHNTTSNMGTCLMPASADDLFMMQMAQYVKKHSKVNIPILITEQPRLWTDMSTSKYLVKHGLTLEIGPQTHGTLAYETYKAMKEVVKLLLDFIDLYNSGHEFEGGSVEIYRIQNLVTFPLCPKGYPTATIHPELQAKDWEPLKPGDPIFITFDGETIKYNGEETVYPAFVAEAAYYEKKTAFWITQKELIDMPSLRKDENS